MIEIINNRKTKKRSNQQEPITLRDYQEEAINAWILNGYKGFLVMATGTGKTWTALFAAKRLVDQINSLIVIVAPYKHLVKQWAEDVQSLFVNSDVILVSGENPKWEEELRTKLLEQKHGSKKQLIVISTIASFGKDKFKNAIKKYKSKRLLIVDEAHRFKDRNEELISQYEYMLGLSATPFSGTSAESGRQLMDYFGGQVYNLPLEDALQRGCLVNYYYKPIIVYANTVEEEEFNKQSALIASCFRNNICIDPDKLIRAKRNRLRIISMAEEKLKKLNEIIKNVQDKDHIIVYCGDGKLFDDNYDEEVKHIYYVKDVLNSLGYKSSQFTAQENIDTRMSLVNAFNKGDITALAAIRCLDEGINIPSIKSALILSSNDDYREFVQRRGRILRKYPNKDFATIYDVLVLPGTYLTTWAKIELRRFHEYAKLSLNHEELSKQLSAYLSDYSLTMDDIDVFDYEVEGELDE